MQLFAPHGVEPSAQASVGEMNDADWTRKFVGVGGTVVDGDVDAGVAPDVVVAAGTVVFVVDECFPLPDEHAPASATTSRTTVRNRRGGVTRA